jgi:hypothetical protein
MIETVEQAKELFESDGRTKVIRATLHEEAGAREVWFVMEDNMGRLDSPEQLLAVARGKWRPQSDL